MLSTLIVGAVLSVGQCPSRGVAISPARVISRIATAPFRMVGHRKVVVSCGVPMTHVVPVPAPASFVYSSIPVPVVPRSSCPGGVCPAR